MVQQQTLSDYSTSVPQAPANGHPGGGYFVAVRLDDFSAESLAATTIYSRKDFYKISLITGHATYHYLDRTYTVEPGECVLVFTNRDVPYRWEVHEGVCSGYSCMFTADFLPLHTHHRPTDWTVFDADGQSVFRLGPDERERFVTLFQKILAEQASSYRYKYDLLFVYVLECIHDAMKLQPEAVTLPQTAATRLVASFNALLASQFPLVYPYQELELRNPQAYADKLAVHTNYLNRALKTVTGKTTTELLTERIMQEARALLLHSNWSISQISDSLGFDEPTHFGRAFRKHTGQTPSALRQTV
jgi:AraC family transcriptional regulator, transcriptional activator of pobA